ncbi:MAG TPA: hypothetical protein VK626_01690 [Nitrospiraceae bacterium]|nr:hypothetical protein [Nitrospiraceae bacterium]
MTEEIYAHCGCVKSVTPCQCAQEFEAYLNDEAELDNMDTWPKDIYGYWGTQA